MKNLNAFNKYLLVNIIIILAITKTNAQDSTKIKKLLNDLNYGVPSSPAFELLPNKPSEVIHLSSISDLTGHINNFISNGKLQTGEAFDIRPFAYQIGSLTEYQHNPIKRILWRTVFSIGTSATTDNKSDIFVGVGLRIPIIDNGDLRANLHFTDLIESHQLVSLNQYPQPTNEERNNPALYRKRISKLRDIKSMKDIRDSLLSKTWNAQRLEVGIGNSERAASGFFRSDSIFKDRIGIWIAYGIPIGSKGQVTLSGSNTWISAKSDTSENKRIVLGSRARYFFSNSFALSGEYAYIKSNHELTNLSENWGHLAIVAEIKIPALGGWVGLGYGGDSSHRTNTGANFMFNYAIYTSRQIKK